MGEPHNVAAITPSWRNLANPKSAVTQNTGVMTQYSVLFDESQLSFIPTIIMWNKYSSGNE